MQIVKENQFEQAVVAIEHCRTLLESNARMFPGYTTSRLNVEVTPDFTEWYCEVLFNRRTVLFNSQSNTPELAIADITDQMARYFNPEKFEKDV